MTSLTDRPPWQMPEGHPQAADDKWTYQLDDSGVLYGPGWWPFYTDPNDNDGNPWTRGCKSAPRGVRLAPDVDFRAWRTEYVLIGPAKQEGLAEASCYLVTENDEHLAVFYLRLTAGVWTAEVPDLESPAKEILNDKTARVIAFLEAAVTDRDSGTIRPVTAADMEDARQAGEPR